MKKWKKQCNSEIREKLKDLNLSIELGDIKRMTNRWSAPDDGKTYWDDPKAYRK